MKKVSFLLITGLSIGTVTVGSCYSMPGEDEGLGSGVQPHRLRCHESMEGVTGLSDLPPILPESEAPGYLRMPDDLQRAQFRAKTDFWWVPLGRFEVSLPRGNPTSAAGMVTWGALCRGEDELRRTIRLWRDKSRFAHFPIVGSGEAELELEHIHALPDEHLAGRMYAMPSSLDNWYQKSVPEPIVGLLRISTSDSAAWKGLFERESVGTVFSAGSENHSWWHRAYYVIPSGTVVIVRLHSESGKSEALRQLQDNGAVALCIQVCAGQDQRVVRTEQLLGVRYVRRRE